MTRRSFLQWLTGGLAAVVGGASLLAPDSAANAAAASNLSRIKKRRKRRKHRKKKKNKKGVNKPTKK